MDKQSKVDVEEKNISELREEKTEQTIEELQREVRDAEHFRSSRVSISAWSNMESM